MHEPIKHRTTVHGAFIEVCRIVELAAEAILSEATTSAANHVADLVESSEDALPGFDPDEPVSIFVIDPQLDGAYEAAWIDFSWTADPTKRILPHAQARLELRPDSSSSSRSTELLLSAEYTPDSDASRDPTAHITDRRIATEGLRHFLDRIAEAITQRYRATATADAAAPSAAVAEAVLREQTAPAAQFFAEAEPTTMKRFRNILFVALTAGSEVPAGLDDAAALADRNGASLTVLGVVAAAPDRQRDLLVHSGGDRVCDLLAAELTARLDAWVGRFSGNQIRAHVAVGSAPAEIVRQVLANNHDLLVVTHDRSDDSAATVRRLFRLCPCPVWVMRSGHDGGQVLAAIDPDDNPKLNRTILQLAQSQAVQRAGELHVAHAWDVYGAATLAESEFLPISNAVLGQLAGEAQRAHSEAFKEAIDDSGIRGHTEHLVNGTPMNAIVGLIHLYRIDLLVMGSIGHTQAEGITVGHTAEQLFAAVQCSVLLLKPPGFRSPLELQA
jgi:nucleotide-binding universal stress UspA family protein